MRLDGFVLDGSRSEIPLWTEIQGPLEDRYHLVLAGTSWYHG